MELKAFNFVQGFGCEIALTAAGADNDGNIFHYQEVSSLAVGSGHPSKACPFLPANATQHCDLSYLSGNLACSAETRTRFLTRRRKERQEKQGVSRVPDEIGFSLACLASLREAPVPFSRAKITHRQRWVPGPQEFPISTNDDAAVARVLREIHRESYIFPREITTSFKTTSFSGRSLGPRGTLPIATTTSWPFTTSPNTECRLSRCGVGT